MQHGFGQRGDLRTGHPAQHDGHQPGGHLVIGNVAVRVCGNELFDFFAGEFARVSLATDQINDAHAFEGSVRGCVGKLR